MEKITKEEIKRLMEIEGKVRGVVFQTDAEYVRLKKGEGGLKKVEEKTKEFGYPIDYHQIKTMDWYPLGMRAISLLAIKETFNWGEKEIFEMGNVAPKSSFLVRLILKIFDLKRTFQEVPKYWERHYLVGKLENYQFNEKEKYIIIRLKEFKLHPLICVYLAGYFLRIGQYAYQGKLEVKETKCPHRGDPYHEFFVRW